MKEIVFIILFFSIMLNFAVGTLGEIFPQFDATQKGGMSYNPGFQTEFDDTFNQSINSAGQIQKTDSFLNSLFDILGLGFITQIFDVVNQYAFGFINLLQNIFGTYLGDNLSTFLFGGIKAILSMAYAIAAFYIFTGRVLVEGE